MRVRRGSLLVFGLVAIALGAVLFARFGGKQRTRFPYATGAIDPHVYDALAGAPRWARSSVEVAPGVRINGLVRRPVAPSAPWVFFLSGNDATLFATAAKFLERVRGADDWGIAVYAYRGYESSSGMPERDAIAADTRVVYDDLLRREQLRPGRVHVVAFSLGAYFAAHLVGQLARELHPVASLSLLAPAESIVMVRPGWAARLTPGDVIELSPLLDAVPAPVLVVQGSADATTGVVQGRAVAARLGQRARYLELDGVTHADLMGTHDAVRAVRTLIRPEI